MPLKQFINLKDNKSTLIKIKEQHLIAKPLNFIIKIGIAIRGFDVKTRVSI